MNRSMSTWWPLHGGRSRFSREPGAALFQGLRIRLTLWYCLVLGAALVLFGVSLYLLAQYFLLGTIENGAATQAYDRAKQWLADTRDHGCGQFPGPPPGQGSTLPMLMVCFDRNGFLLPY